MRSLFLLCLLAGGSVVTTLGKTTTGVSSTTPTPTPTTSSASTIGSTSTSTANTTSPTTILLTSTVAPNSTTTSASLTHRSGRTPNLPGASTPPNNTGTTPATASTVGTNGGSSGGLTWMENLNNLLGILTSSLSSKPATANVTQSLGDLFLGLPGVLKGLGGLQGLGGNDVSNILTGLLNGNQSTSGVPAWIQSLTQGINSTKAMHNVDIITNVLSDLGSVDNDKVIALLKEIFPDVTQGLASLNLNDNSTSGEILSAIFSNNNLTSAMSTVAKELAAGLLTDPKKFPIDPTSTCAAHLHAWGEGLAHGEAWAFQMLDAGGKLTSGLVTGQNIIFGDYDECMELDSKDRGVQGQFFVMHVKIPQALLGAAPALGALPNPTLQIHLCMPRSCEATRLLDLFNPSIESLGTQITGLDKLEPPNPSGDNVFLGVMITLGILCFLSTIGTIYGVYVDNKKKTKKQNDALPEEMAVTGNGYVNGGFKSHEDPDEKKDVVTHRVVDRGNIRTVLETAFSDSIDVVNLSGARVNGRVKGGGAPNGHSGVVAEVGGMPVNGTAPVSTASPVMRAAEEEGILSKLLLSFSLLRNGRKLLDCTKTQTDISCLHGIRVLSITWVILGHVFAMLGETQGNKTAVARLLTSPTFMVIPGALFSVDTFFLLSGCLTSFVFLRSTKKSGLTVSGMILYYWHRYWRLTPFYGLIIAFYAGVFPYLVKGPFQNVVGLDSAMCRKYWYENILYVNNLGSTGKMCVVWSWYLSNDMQFYFIAPICLIPWALKGRTRILGFVMAVALILTHIITTWVLAASEGLSMFGSRNKDYGEMIYEKPWCRVGPYAVGLLLGYVLATTRCRYSMEKMSTCLGWLMAAAVALTSVYINNDNLGDFAHGARWNDMESAAYEALAKVGWAMFVAWVVFACCTGHGGFINTILSWRAWAPLSRLSYGVYLVHLVVMATLQGNWRRPFYLDSWTATSLFLTVTVLSFLVAFVFSLLIEAPTLGVEKAVLGKVLRRKK